MAVLHAHSCGPVLRSEMWVYAEQVRGIIAHEPAKSTKLRLQVGAIGFKSGKVRKGVEICGLSPEALNHHASEIITDHVSRINDC